LVIEEENRRISPRKISLGPLNPRANRRHFRHGIAPPTMKTVFFVDRDKTRVGNVPWGLEQLIEGKRKRKYGVARVASLFLIGDSTLDLHR